MHIKPLFFGYQWHITRSNAFHRVFRDVFHSESFQIVHHSKSWDFTPPSSSSPHIYLQVKPDDRVLQAHKHIAWVPMYDQMLLKSELESLVKLPRNLKIVCFCRALHKILLDRGFVNTLCVQYFPELVRTDKGKTRASVFYWNRTNFMPASFFQKLYALGFRVLYLRENLDPGFTDSLKLSELGEWEVRPVPAQLNSEDYFKLLAQVQLMVASRPIEGIGLTTLDSLSCGTPVVGCDLPTFNEYIVNEDNGFLFSRGSQSFLFRIMNKFASKLRLNSPFEEAPHFYPFHLWPSLVPKDLSRVGGNARDRISQGLARWLIQCEELRQFVAGNL